MMVMYTWILLGICGTFFPGALSAQEDATWRGVHIDHYVSPAEIGRELPALAGMGINVLIYEINYHFEYQSHPELRGDGAFSKQSIQSLVEQCDSLGIRLIPQFNCIAHQSPVWASTNHPLLTVYPELDLTPGAYPNNGDGSIGLSPTNIYCREWDPLNPRVNEIVFALMDELIEAFQSRFFHVGMDEIFLLSDSNATTKDMDPASIIAMAVNQYYDHIVVNHGLEMMMWGDRLIDASEIDYGEWEASRNGTAPAIDSIPADIIICDWHYRERDEYPSIPMFLEKGFRVFPSGWKNAAATAKLIQYSIQVADTNMLGHLFTTWGEVQMDDLTSWPPLVQGLPEIEDYHRPVPLTISGSYGPGTGPPLQPRYDAAVWLAVPLKDFQHPLYTMDGRRFIGAAPGPGIYIQKLIH